MNKRNQVQLVGFTVGEEIYQTTIPAKYQNRKPYQAPNPKMITSFMPGTIQEVYVSEGEKIGTTTRLCILEAMKMKNIIFSQEGGIIKKINVKPGQLVPKGCVLVELV
ncbi:MAG TPA: acetyl-CoA carboxylase biotin carboxyl carrier protein subunit [Bacteroidales bacterium]|nr:acetyl-CoA carboxylase biotin carboxyl carrier protein subunit [Bacteroidales bacterium]